MTKIYVFSSDFNTVYHSAGDAFTSVVVEANDEAEARELLKTHPDFWSFGTLDEDVAGWDVKTADELQTGEPRVILLTYGMY